MSDVDRVVLGMNAVLAVVAFGACMVGARFGDPRRRPVWTAVAITALVYVAGFLWVIATENVPEWSRLFRGVSIVVWPLVWATPPLHDAWLQHRDMHRVKRIDERVRS